MDTYISPEELKIAAKYGLNEQVYRAKRAAYQGPQRVSLACCTTTLGKRPESTANNTELLVREVIGL